MLKNNVWEQKEFYALQPNGGITNNKARFWKKILKRGGGYDQKHISLKCDGTIYNRFKNKYVCSNLA